VACKLKQTKRNKAGKGPQVLLEGEKMVKVKRTGVRGVISLRVARRKIKEKGLGIVT